MGIAEYFFWEKHGKLAHLQILAPKIFPGKGIPNFKEAAFKASKSTKEGKGWNYNSDESDTEK